MTRGTDAFTSWVVLLGGPAFLQDDKHFLHADRIPGFASVG